MTKAPIAAADLARALRAELLKRSFAAFVEYFWLDVAGVPLVRNRAVDEVIAVLQRVGDGELWRVLIAMPSGVGKSTLLSLFSAWRRARNPGHRSINMMHSSSGANRESLRVRRLVEGLKFQALFPELKLRDDEATIASWTTTLNGRYIAAGRETNILGQRCLEAVLDDPLDANDRFSSAAKEGLWAWFGDALMSRLDGDRCPVVVVHQRLSQDDLIGRLIEQGGWHLLELPAEADDGTLLAPTVLSRARLDELKAQNPSGYAAMFLQRPSDDTNATIKRTWWRFHYPVNVSPVAPRPLGCNLDVPAIPTPTCSSVVIACDLTFGSAKGDYVAIQAWGASGAGRFLLARFRKRCGLLESVAAIQSMRARFPGAKVIVEKAANGAGAIEELKAAGVHGVVGVKPLGSKVERIGLVSATIEAGDCFLPLALPGLGEFVEELAGATKHDDEQDCAAYAIHELNRASVRTTYEAHPGHAISEENEERRRRELASFSPEDQAQIRAIAMLLGGRGGSIRGPWR